MLQKENWEIRMSLQILISIWYNATPGSVSTKGVFLMFFIPRDSQNPVLIRFIYVLLESRGKNSRQTTGECGLTHVNGFSQSRQKWNNLLPSFQQILQQKIFRSIQPQKYWDCLNRHNSFSGVQISTNRVP